MRNLQKHLFLFASILFPFFFNATTIPFELIDGKIVVSVNIKNTPHNFIFDSGAFTIISSELKDQLNEKKSKTIFEAVDANNAKSKMEVFSTDKLQISDLNIKNLNFSFADISWMSGRACKKISGIFGANMMKQKLWRIDFKSKTINVFEKSQEQSNIIAAIPFLEENFTSVPKINAKIRNQNIEFIFDTGSGMGFTVNQKSYDKIKDKNFLTFEGLLSQSLNSIVKGQRQVDLMEVEFNNTKLGNQIIDSSSDSPNLIGTRFIENYLVDLDFINKKIILAKTEKTPEYQSFGVAFAPIDNSLIIVNKLEIPQLSDLKLTDKIVKINNTDVSKMNPEDFCKIKELLEQNTSITIENESHKKFTLEKKDILKYLN
ncbi:aspartyl protease family protein [Chryseobacterium sp. MEBOG06]|uniref:aspartyl protease family protein n=1 Tax=Chryseobacterium sp. MEBOG06 TaxID=2879938 RepID=UPI001F2AE251|nr:aspartyl protease family protein [Chryseobacterium sp. MEBOG06]UKB82326.1 aspartyl protease family protein [Chryseobacterium sp. MEBOG06]